MQMRRGACKLVRAYQASELASNRAQLLRAYSLVARLGLDKYLPRSMQVKQLAPVFTSADP